MLDERDREKAAHAVKSRCKLRAKSESWSGARFSWPPSPARHLLLLNSLILYVLFDRREYESPSARLDFSHQIRNGTISKARNLQAIPNRDEIFVLNFRKSN